MKKTIIVNVAIMLFTVTAQATMFLPIDLTRPQTSAGIFNNFRGNTDGGGVVALFTPAPQAPELLSGFVPLDIGGTVGKGLGGPSVALGMGLNMLPASKAFLLTLICAVSRDDQFTNIKDWLQPPFTGSIDLVPFIGPHENAVFRTLTHVELQTTLFIGGTLKFGAKAK